MANPNDLQNYTVINDMLMKEKHKFFHPFLTTTEDVQNDVNDHVFHSVLDDLKKKFKVLHILTGDENFQKLAYEYFKYNPAHSAKLEKYGSSLAHFLEGMDEIDRFPYLVWIAQIDWLWFEKNISNIPLKLPKGSLQAWLSIKKNDQKLDLFFDSNNNEEIIIQNINSQWMINTL